MKRICVSLLVFAIATVYGSTGANQPVRSTSPLTADEIEIYRSIIQQRSGKDSGILNVSRLTYPLDPESPTSGLSRAECLRGIELDNLPNVSRSFHELTPDVLPDANARLVDPKKHSKIARANDPDKTIKKGKSVEDAVRSAMAAGLFSMSEIAFDKAHHYAVVSYSFWCGSLCGNGASVVFEKTNGKWRKANRNCGGWIS